MNMVKTFVMAKSPKIDLVGIYYQIKPTFCRKQINISHFVLYNTFLECCNPRFLNKTEIKITKVQSSGHNANTSNSKNWRYVHDQTICLRSMIKLSELRNHSLLAGNIITKPYFSLLPLLKNLRLYFKSIHFCSNQFKFSGVKANAIHLHCYI